MPPDDESSPPTRTDAPHPARIAATRITSDRYRLGDRIGQGGMGEVVAARDEQIGRDVAIKRIRHAQPTDQMVNRFLREARIQGRLQHPAIAPVHELGRDAAGLPFFVMKKLAGRTLSAILRDDVDATTRKRLLRGFADVCLAVEFAHVNGVIHRDLKPDNIVLGDFGEVYVLDWGVAKVVGEDDSFDDIGSDEPLTRTGVAVGTRGYMAPEQERGEPDVDGLADVFSLGRVLERILGEDMEAPELGALVARATVADRAQRLQTARALADGVQRYLDGDRDLEQRRRLADEHLARAREAHKIDDAEHRALAIREAGRALALDPTHDAAGELVSRLMLEPPATVPPVVAAELRADAASRTQIQARDAAWTLFGYLVLAPGVVATGSWALAACVVIAVAIALMYLLVTARRPTLPVWIGALCHVPFFVLVAYLFSPLFATPPMVAVFAMALGTHPMLRDKLQWLATGAVLVAALLAPMFAELLDVLPHTFTPRSDGILLHAPALSLGSAFVPFAALGGTAIVTVSLLLPYLLRKREDAIRRALFVQAWQLRQLAPDPQRG